MGSQGSDWFNLILKVKETNFHTSHMHLSKFSLKCFLNFNSTSKVDGVEVENSKSLEYRWRDTPLLR